MGVQRKMMIPHPHHLRSSHKENSFCLFVRVFHKKENNETIIGKYPNSTISELFFAFFPSEYSIHTHKVPSFGGGHNAIIGKYRMKLHLYVQRVVQVASCWSLEQEKHIHTDIDP